MIATWKSGVDLLAAEEFSWIYSEDFNHGQVMLGVRMESPFDAADVDR